ncbi:flagellar filament capping protein FliD [Shewanella sp. 202IG2-18]|uniref:flagellar filament capping protein FliD n=1 Tax=Parashewanella hymeniacidonis TaxID=2807618 RepID=UPI0019602A77|nr:flagellar filament capping protein FliD [Parashewanella hymeniacidonis]MBM7071516.1 flagellar filament capping protein FliD [Parashewanella hymeniacidonis]
MVASAGFIPSQISRDFVNAERGQKDQLFASNLQSYQKQLNAYNALERNLDSLADKLSAIGGDNFAAKSSSVIGDEISATVGTDAPEGTYNVVVSQLAQAEQITKTFTAEDEILPTTGVLNIQLGADPADAISIDLSVVNAAGTETVADLKDMINQHPDNPGVQASLVRTGSSVELMMTSKDSGATNTLAITLDGASWGTTQRQAPKDALFTINGVSITSDTNFVENVIDGISIELDSIHDSGESSVIKIEADSETAQMAVQEFVDAYNELQDQIQSLTRGRGSAATDSESDTVGSLNGDASIRMLEGRLKNTLFESAPSGQRLSDIGIELDRYGKLTVDDAELSNALRDDASAVEALFTDDDGYIDKLEDVLDPFIEFNGFIDQRQSSLQARTDRVEQDMERFDAQMEQRYQLLLAQFTAAESAITQLSSASSLFTNTGASN